MGQFDMRILLVRVGADQSPAGGGFNGPVDLATRRFVYIGIPETRPVRRGYEHRYGSTGLTARLARMGARLPEALRHRNMHLDPDFEHCTYGDHGRRAAQLADLERNDIIVFYAGLHAAGQHELVYALVGQLTVDRHVLAGEIKDPSLNVHAQRRPVVADEVVVIGSRAGSGRYVRCIPIGEFRERAYRVRRELLREWGGLSVRNGFLQRSAGFPHLLHPEKFLTWLATRGTRLIRRNI